MKGRLLDFVSNACTIIVLACICALIGIVLALITSV